MPTPLDPNDTAVVIAAWPTGHVDYRLMRWLIDAQGIPWGSIMVTKIQPRISAYNVGVHDALENGKTHLLFVDHDVVPTGRTGHHPSTDEFLQAAQGDIICCPCRLDIPGAWAKPDAFHCGMWRTTREALLKVEPPWFLEDYSPDGRELVNCCCAHLARRASSAGLTVGRAGWAEHAVKKT